MIKNVHGPQALHARLALVLLMLFLLTAAAYLWLALWSTGRYHQEVTQRINANLATYISRQRPLIRNGRVNRAAMTQLAHQVMVINPSVEVYLLDRQGNILAHALPGDTVVRQRVDPAPIRALLEGRARPPVRDDNPRRKAGSTIFSAARVNDGGKLAGYLYVVLAGQEYRSLADSLHGSYILRLSLAAIAAIALLAFGCAIIIFAALTRPLRRLAGAMERFRREHLASDSRGYEDHPGNEVRILERAFDLMRKRIHDQFERLQENDQMRRELISNVSHDLRTPLASMQGYLETLIIRDTSLGEDQRRQYLETAHRHCQRLTRLVRELFELSKLDTGAIEPRRETFSLAELMQDVVQKFKLPADRKGVALRIQSPEGLYPVCADIALIERVLENLIDNALRYTPRGGVVELSLNQQPRQVEVQIKDTGVGVPKQALPHIFERYYRARQPDSPDGTGLGLAIVKRILELHGSRIEVISEPRQGTRFRFPLSTRDAA